MGLFKFALVVFKAKDNVSNLTNKVTSKKTELNTIKSQTKKIDELKFLFCAKELAIGRNEGESKKIRFFSTLNLVVTSNHNRQNN